MTSIDQSHRKSWIKRHGVSLIAFIAIAAYVVFVEAVWGWAMVLQEWQALGVSTVLLALGLLVSTSLVRAWRIYDYFPRETSGRFTALFHLAQVHNLLNILLPFRSGETSFPLLMRSEFSVPLLSGTSALLVMRLLDLHALLAAAGLGLVLGRPQPQVWGMAWLLFLVLPLIGFALKRPAILFAKTRFSGRLLKIVEGVEAGLPAHKGAFFRAWAMTIVTWGTKVLVFAWVLSLMQVTPLSAAFGGALGGELSSVLPFHAPAGVGTYPAGIVAGAAALGAAVQDMDGLAKAAVNLHLIVIVSALLSAALSLALHAVFPSPVRKP
ncbi:membrane protein [Agrobacterium vitis]|uniref:lysylphosphatidylglycerol synthase domain-containing protein n=1 Tax=Agrobacterium vitis TaxID=373 RepID=UPI0015DA0031|nr:lysylphosphatidylglycerol synthase domain-containing protein [Agrobacterium vitis]BCH65454.1 membrane protein [Agrobacterium vitis]